MSMKYQNLRKSDPEIYALIKKEEKRQKEGLELIPSESNASDAVLEAVGSFFNGKYGEGYPGKRYYGGCVYVDALESLTQERAIEGFGAKGYRVNVQPYSGSPANGEVYFALLKPGDVIMSLRLDEGGHLTHGSPVSLPAKFFKFVHYALDPAKDVLDYDEIARLAEKIKPKLILSGFTAYPRKIDFSRMGKIAKLVGAISMADISHISGLILGGVHPSPFPYIDIVTTTTHKTLRGPRAAMIFSRAEYGDQIDRMVFPGMQGGPHFHTIAGIAVALNEASKPAFKKYAEGVVKNAKVLAEELMSHGLTLVSGGTDTHLMIINLLPFGPGRGVFVEKALEAVNISVNKSPVPRDPSPPYYPSGIRLGTPAITSRNMKEKEMKVIAKIIAKIVKEFAAVELPEDKEKRKDAVLQFANNLAKDPLIKKTRAEVAAFAKKFPVPGID